MPNHDRFECQTAIDSDAILQIHGDNICLKLFGMQVYVADLYQLMSTGLNLI